MTAVPKKKRIVDEELLEKIRQLPCAIKGRLCTGDIDPHHIKSRGAGGDDVEENLIPLCREHHTEIHQIGKIKFRSKYPHLHLSNKTWD